MVEELAKLAACFMLASRVANPSTPKMGATYSFKMLVEFQRAIRHRIPKQRTLRNNSCESLKSVISALCPQSLGINSVYFPKEH
jgi:hypothetical protein